MGFFSGNKRKGKGPHFKGLSVLVNHFADTPIAPADYPKCNCFNEYYAWERRFDNARSDDECRVLEGTPLVWSKSIMHSEGRFTSQRAWDIACEIIESAERKCSKELNLGKVMDRSDYMALNSLPDSIGQLKNLEKLTLYGSNISYIPRAISGCENLQSFHPYTSYRLHWLPFEIRRCRKLSNSCISTRALYGNYKFRSPFPDLKVFKWIWPTEEGYCSICDTKTENLDQYWISQVVAMDVVPLLVSVCSVKCLEMIGDGARGYLMTPHKGGLNVDQPVPE
jgi:hypothetical protein